ncbi:EBDP4, emopamil-binding protein [Aspergillus coremiiformis]|uniref:EBDP4, emopamil-binding protein n=1 Tax=Aspergillus coremiiformis TaxID=138285 RepID=A0A5N6ZG96_9EURO|nr:EBDP4, emopamil-binding protein [Aspergillus coremiiformis]
MPSHPYYPPTAAMPNYIPKDKSTLELLSIFTITCSAILAITHKITLANRPQIPKSDLLTTLWFVLCGFIHLILEGYYSLNFLTLASQQTLLATLWKEYALSDSRYLVPNNFVLCMESVTAFLWGPLSFLVAYLVVSEHRFRYPVQGIVSLGQLYGDVLYFGIAGFDFLVFGIEYSRPERGYFWGYFVFLNAIWIVVPIGLLWQSVVVTGRAFGVVQKIQTGFVDGKKVL